ncbi:MAG: hypothetical protein RJA70_4755, partial [Pseudomonadota bacterium]
EQRDGAAIETVKQKREASGPPFSVSSSADLLLFEQALFRALTGVSTLTLVPYAGAGAFTLSPHRSPRRWHHSAV